MNFYKHSELYFENNWNYFLLCDQQYCNESILHILKNIDETIGLRETKILQEGKHSTVMRIKIGDRYFVVKRYDIKGFLHNLKHRLRSSRALKSWFNANLLLSNDILTAKPIAVLEKRFGPVRRSSYLLMEYLEGETVLQFFSSKEKNMEEIEDIVEKLIRLLKRLGQCKIRHGDMHINNIILVNQELLLVDLHAVKKYSWKWLSKRKHQKDVKRFLRSFNDKPALLNMFHCLLP